MSHIENKKTIVISIESNQSLENFLKIVDYADNITSEFSELIFVSYHNIGIDLKNLFARKNYDLIFIKNEKNYNEEELTLQGLFRSKNIRTSILKLDDDKENGFYIIEGKTKVLIRNALKRKKLNLKNNTKLSIVIPVYNCQEHLQRCLNSISNSKLDEFEVIVVDDGSKDGTLDIIKKKIKLDPRFTFISCTEPSGHPGTPRNIGISVASGQYIGFVDSDDWVGPTFFEDLYKEAIRDSFDIVSSSRFFRVEDKKISEVNFNYIEIDSCEDDSFVKSGYFSNVWNRIYKRELILGKGIYFPDLYISEDYCFSLAIHLLSAKTSKIKGGSYHYLYNRKESTTDLRRGEAGLAIIENYHRELDYFENMNLLQNMEEYYFIRRLGSFVYTFERLQSDLKFTFKKNIRQLFSDCFNPKGVVKLDESELKALKKLDLVDLLEEKNTYLKRAESHEFFVLANSLMRKGAIKEAQEIYEKIYDVNSSALFNLLISLLKQNNYGAIRLLINSKKGLEFFEDFNSIVSEFINLDREKFIPPANPKLSIIIPVYNSGKYLNTCLESVLNQNYKNIEVIIINDGSTDNSYQVIEKYLSDKRVFYIENEKPSGNPGSPRNIGINKATGFYTAFVDSDDWVSADFFEDLIGAGRVGSDIVFSSGYTNCIGEKKVSLKYNNEHFNSPEHPLYRYHESFTIWDKIYRTDFLRSNKIYLGETSAAVDVIFVFKCYFYCNFAAFSSENDGYFYRRESDSSVTLNKRKKTNCNFEFEAYKMVDEWALSENLPTWFLDLICIKKVNSFLYTLSIISNEFRDEFINRVNVIFNNFNDLIISEYMELTGRSENLKKFKDMKVSFSKKSDV